MSGMKYIYVIERTKTGYSAFVPDLPGCVATGKTLATVRRAMREAVDFHLEGMREDGMKIPRPSAVADSVPVAPLRRKAG